MTEDLTGGQLADRQLDTPENGQREPVERLLVFAIGALVGAGFAAIWIPERRRSRLPARMGKRYRRVCKAGGTAIDEIRKAGREIANDFREELGASLEAAREEFLDMARRQLEQTRRTLQREYKKVRG